MGLFKQMKDMKNMVEQAPGVIAQAQQTAAQAQEYAVAQQAAAQQAAQQAMAATDTAADAGTGNFAPINGVTLEQYAALCKQLGAGAGDAVTVKLNGEAPLLPSGFETSLTLKVIGPSSSLIVPVAVASASAALVGDESVTVKASAPSGLVSPITGTVKFWVSASPAFQVSVWDVAV